MYFLRFYPVITLLLKLESILGLLEFEHVDNTTDENSTMVMFNDSNIEVLFNETSSNNDVDPTPNSITEQNFSVTFAAEEIKKSRQRRQPHGDRNQKIKDDYQDLARSGLICNLCVVVDEQFVRAYQLKDSSHIVSKIREMVDRVSWIFRSIDWNNDGEPDNVGFHVISLVRGWNPFQHESSWSYDTPRPAMELLGLFARHNFRSCCLGIGFTNRPFVNKQVGVSFIASPTMLGGVCDYRNPVPPLISANVALISSKGLQGSLMSFNDIGTVLLHELGHTFGVLKHDMDLASSECSGFESDKVLPANYMSEEVNPPNGRFIMWGQEIQGLKNFQENNLKFSPCSRDAVNRMLYGQRGRINCFTMSDVAFCGNGIVEFPEECDCGNELSCASDGCCGSRVSAAPCQLFKGMNPETCKLINQAKKNATADLKKKQRGSKGTRFWDSRSGIFLIIISTNFLHSYTKVL